MKNTVRLVVATVFAAMQLCVQAVTVTTVDGLKDAVANANAGDTIVIGASLTPSESDFAAETDSSKSFLTVTVNNLTIMGVDESSRKTWTEGSEPVVINCGSVGRFVQNNGSNLTVKNLTITGCKLTGTTYGTIAQGGTTMFTNCVFRQNTGSRTAFWSHGNFTMRDCAYVSNQASLTGYAYGCDMSGNTGVAKFISGLYDCKYLGHNLPSSTAITLNNGAVVSNCHFKANNCSNLLATGNDNALIADCYFENNTNTLLSASLKAGATGVSVTNCTFTENVVTEGSYHWINGHRITIGTLIKNATNNFASVGDAQRHFSIQDSRFNGNRYGGSNSDMAEVYGVHATDCTFGAHGSDLNNAWNHYNMSAFESYLQGCDIMGGDITDCVLNRCKVHDVTNGMYACFRDYCRVTNTIVFNFAPINRSGSAAAKLYAAVFQHDAEFVNCTFVTNTALTYRSHHEGNSFTPEDVKFINCIFNGNRDSSLTATDFSMQNESATAEAWASHVSFSNTFYGAFVASGELSQSAFDAKTGDGALMQCVDPKFVKDSSADAPYWSLSLKSPLLGKGDPLDFTDSDLDLAGKQRLKDGKIDIGCYQCWLNPAGFMMIVY